MKTNVIESVLVTLKMGLASLPTALLILVMRYAVPERPVIILLVGLFGLWLTGKLANSWFGWK